MSTYQSTYGTTIQEAFDVFHKANPKIYEIFEGLVETARRRGKTKVSSKMLLGVIKWEYFLQTDERNLFTDSEGVKHKFRINDAYTSRYARIYTEKHKDKPAMFEFRRLRS